MSDKPYTNMTPEEARAMLDKYNETDLAAFLKAFKAEIPTKDSPVKTGSIAPVVPGGDIHRHIASIMYGVEPGEVTTVQRVAANERNFLYLYLYASNLSYEDAVPLMEAQARAFAAAREKAESEGGK